MRILFIIMIVVSLASMNFAGKDRTKKKKDEVIHVHGTASSVAVLELFTSEGCSSCPPADNLLPQLAKEDTRIIPLSFHVDYWNRLGWTDPFSSAAFSELQRDYASQLNLESV